MRATVVNGKQAAPGIENGQNVSVGLKNLAAGLG